jgi:FlaA1/EpsC-like NDP-sugar epimerase
MKVLITGASGSIGKEIVKQLIENNEIICFDRNEEKIFYLEKELLEKYPNCKLTVCLGSITDIDRIKQVFDIYKPDIVYHTAANKHVPLGEENIHEFVYNNIQGTINLSNVALAHETKFIFISTDKAVEPSSVMGYTKRMCEKYLLALNKNIVICRFGNIIGSSGSVYEIFDKQAQKGTITLTHEEMERYFITVEEAVSNLIYSSNFNSGLYIFNMGNPVKIMNIAKSYQDIHNCNINITGLREGEKLKEKLHYDFEKLQSTSNENILEVITSIDVEDKISINKLVLNANNLTKKQIITKFKQINHERNS